MPQTQFWSGTHQDDFNDSPPKRLLITFLKPTGAHIKAFKVVRDASAVAQKSI